jgi:hypothetical protein
MGNCFLTQGSCLCVGKNEVALLYNWLQMFRLSTSAWNTKEQTQYQDSPWVDSFRYNCRCFIHIWLNECISDFQYWLHFLRYFILFALFYSVKYWTGEDEYISYFQCSLYFCKKCIIFVIFCSVWNWWRKASHFQCSLYFCKIFYCFCYILFSMELVKKNYQIFNDHYISFRCF